jgi:hypothetical protein
MTRRRPDPDQALFAWVWHDPSDNRPDGPEDNDPADDDNRPPPPLRSRVRDRHADLVVSLWGWPVRLARRPPTDRG